MHHCIYARGKITVGDKCRCCYNEPSRSRQQALVNATGKLRHGRITTARSDRSESVDHPRDGPKQPEQRRQESNCSKHGKKSLQLWDFELRGFLHDVAQFPSRRIVPDNRSMDHSRHRAWRTGGLVQSLSEIATANQVRQSFQELAYMDGRAMEIKKTLRKNGN